ncbi:FAD-dependent oxidoreductase [Microbacterium suaedae]|uniref:FAD-dependent oxidoreductase n=1 Tax=Microbacterium suaedae TaxID=2067813 RepID=UPI000DAB9135|nr:FAD-dependent oxidoreductase [Microbacterium suaedae]
MCAPDVDVAVVGAGIVGSAIAAACLAAGARVRVVDPDPGGGATYAAAGMLSPFGELEHTEPVLHALGRVAVAMYPRFVAGIPGGAEACAYEREPTLLLGADAADARSLDELNALAGGSRCASAAADGATRPPDQDCAPAAAGVRWLSSREARSREPLLAPGISRALLAEGDHRVDPRRLAAALRSGIGDRVERTRAARIARNGAGRVTGIELADGRVIRARETVIAHGTGHVDGVDLGGAVRPVHGDILRLYAPAGMRLRHTVRGRVRGRPVYLVPRPDGTLVVGATQREDGDEGVSAGGVHALLRDAIALVPSVEESRFVAHSARARPATPDHLPLVGRAADGLLVATGTNRAGVLLAPLIAQAIAALAAGDEPDIDIGPLDPRRFLGARKHGASDTRDPEPRIFEGAHT